MMIKNKFNFWKKAALSAAIMMPVLSGLFMYSANSLSSSNEQMTRYLVNYSTDQAKQAIANLTAEDTDHAVFFNSLKVAAVNLSTSEKDQLTHTAGIQYIEPNEVYATAAQAFAPSVKAITVKGKEQASWGYGAVDAEIALDKGYTGKGVKVAILDTGISSHSDLNIAGGISVVDYTSSYADDNGHGTFVAGVIGALNNGKGLIGEAPDASIYAVKILDKAGNGSTEDLAKGLDWAIQNKMDIINMSIAFPESSPVVEQMLKTAYQNNILLVAAAGNHGTADVTQDTIEYPAKSSYVIGVTAIDDSFERASFSATGKEAEISAPGVAIVSTASNGKYELRDGTSVAAPFVTGMAAVLKQAYPHMTNDQIRSTIAKNSIDLDALGKDDPYGYGLLSFQHVLDNAAAK